MLKNIFAKIYKNLLKYNYITVNLEKKKRKIELHRGHTVFNRKESTARVASFSSSSVSRESSLSRNVKHEGTLNRTTSLAEI